VGRLDEAGFTVIFGRGKCTIRGEDEVDVRVVPRTSMRNYKVEHEEGVANLGEERLTLDKFHQCMGHISSDVGHKLIKDNMVTGVRLKYMPFKKFLLRILCLCKGHPEASPKVERGSEGGCFW
jgi:hypothetical protein